MIFGILQQKLIVCYTAIKGVRRMFCNEPIINAYKRITKRVLCLLPKHSDPPVFFCAKSSSLYTMGPVRGVERFSLSIEIFLKNAIIELMSFN
jgi:hypothetical protein